MKDDFYMSEKKDQLTQKKDHKKETNSSLNVLLSVLKGSVTNCFNLLMAIKNKTLFSVIWCIHCVLHVAGCIDKHIRIVKINK